MKKLILMSILSVFILTGCSDNLKTMTCSFGNTNCDTKAIIRYDDEKVYQITEEITSSVDYMYGDEERAKKEIDELNENSHNIKGLKFKASLNSGMVHIETIMDFNNADLEKMQQSKFLNNYQVTDLGGANDFVNLKYTIDKFEREGLSCPAQ